MYVYCYNIIYNDRPILLEKGEINNRKVRIDLTFENENQADEILKFYIYDKKNEKLLGTKGHFTRSVD